MKISDLPALPGRTLFWTRLAGLVVVIGVTIGVAGAVRSAGILVAIGSALYAYNSYTSALAKRRIELAIPVIAAFILLVVSITLPHAH